MKLFIYRTKFASSYWLPVGYKIKHARISNIVYISKKYKLVCTTEWPFEGLYIRFIKI